MNPNKIRAAIKMIETTLRNGTVDDAGQRATLEATLTDLRGRIAEDDAVEEELSNAIEAVSTPAVELPAKAAHMIGRDFEWTEAGGTCGKGGQSAPVGQGSPYIRILKAVVGGK